MVQAMDRGRAAYDPSIDSAMNDLSKFRPGDKIFDAQPPSYASSRADKCDSIMDVEEHFRQDEPM
jgi:hypothetical protein